MVLIIVIAFLQWFLSLDVSSHNRMTTAGCVIPDFTQDKRAWMYCWTPTLPSILSDETVAFTFRTRVSFDIEILQLLMESNLLGLKN